MKKFIMFIAGVMSASTITVFATNIFVDQNDLQSWNEDAVLELYNDGILTGYSDGSVMPNKEVTRAEVAVLLKRMKDFLLDEIDDSQGGITVSTSIDDEGFDYLVSRIDELEDSFEALEESSPTVQSNSYSEVVDLLMSLHTGYGDEKYTPIEFALFVVANQSSMLNPENSLYALTYQPDVSDCTIEEYDLDDYNYYFEVYSCGSYSIENEFNQAYCPDTYFYIYDYMNDILPIEKNRGVDASGWYGPFYYEFNGCMT
mgnify:CR=1 FL=1